MHWFRRNLYGQYLSRVLLAIGSGAGSIALSFLPYDDWLQAGWVILSSLLMGYLVVHQRLNESDQGRYRRVSRNRIRYLERSDPEALTIVLADNVRPAVWNWFADEFHVRVEKMEKIDVLDSLAKSGDRPGQLLFRVGVTLGRWLEAAGNPTAAVTLIPKRLNQFLQEHLGLLGECLAPGVYYREVRTGEQRPVGIHLCHPESHCLFTVEESELPPERDRKQPAGPPRKRTAVALSFQSKLFTNASEEDWNQFKQQLFRILPYFNPIDGGSGPQKPAVPLFVVSGFHDWERERGVIREKLLRVRELLPLPAALPDQHVPAVPREPTAAEQLPPASEEEQGPES